MDVFPAALPLKGRRIVVAGEGDAADTKARLFEGSPAEVVRLDAAAARDPARYAGASLAFIAMPGEAALAAAEGARSAGALVNVVDRPELCDFTTPAIVDRGAVVGAIMTGGAAPVLATELRLALEAQWPTALGQVAALLDGVKAQARARFPDPALRRGVLRALVRGPAAEAALAGDMAEALALARAAIDTDRPSEPRIVLVRAPDAPDLMTLRTLRLLSEADRIVIDAAIDPAIARLARRDAPLSVLEAGRTPDTATLSAWLEGAALLVRLCASDPQVECKRLQDVGLKAEIGA